MNFWPEHAENISYIYVVNQIFVSVSGLFAKQILKKIGPTYGIIFACISSCPVDKKMVHCCFSIIKMKN